MCWGGGGCGCKRFDSICDVSMVERRVNYMHTLIFKLLLHRQVFRSFLTRDNLLLGRRGRLNWHNGDVGHGQPNILGTR